MITKQEMIDRYGDQALIDLTDHIEPYTNTIVDPVLNAAILDATAQVTSFIAGRYRLPLASTPNALKRPVATIVYYILHKTRVTDDARKEYEDALRYLSQISRGEVRLDIEGQEPSSAPADARVEGPEGIFSRESLKGY
jgi:phage gp36-like protein